LVSDTFSVVVGRYKNVVIRENGGK
jgi:hypothetical protein